MKRQFLMWGIMAICVPLVLSSCGSKKFLDSYAPEESGLNVMKITDESSNTVFGHRCFGSISTFGKQTFALSINGGCKKAGFYWNTFRCSALSPDGSDLAYISQINKQRNIMVRKAGPQGSSTQRSFRDIGDLCWGNNGYLYYSDCSDVEHSQIACTKAYAGSIMQQMTNNNIDYNPALTKDGKILFFTRYDKSGPSIWSLELQTGALTSCARGYNPCPIGNKNDTFICVRNTTAGNSEIWMVNFVEGKETLILSDKSRGFTNPTVSPDGQWILCEGNSKSSISKKNNLDIFAVRIDGTNFIQLTYHPASDCCPVWSADGKSIFFISTRANKDEYYNIWKMRFNL
jgi:Tol biopolymer transport system component